MQEKTSWSNQDRFNQAADKWDENPRRVELAKAVAQAIMKQVPMNNQMMALEFGCGTGLISLELISKLKGVIALDSSEQMIAVLRNKAAEQNISNITTVCGDLTENPEELYGKTFHFIFSSMTFHHIMDTDGILAGLKTHLLPGGYLAIADLDKEDGTFHEDGTEKVHHGFNREELKVKLEKAGFQNIHFETAHIMRKPNKENEIKEYPIFLVTAQKF